MAYDRQHLKITFGFDTDGAEEEAFTSVSIAGTSTAYDAAADLADIDEDWLEDRMTELGTLLGHGSLGWADYSRLVSCKAAAVGVDGKYLTDPKFFSNTATPAQGETLQVHPQLTIVLTLWSGATLGKGNYGRVYLPHTMIILTAGTPQGQAATRDSVLSSAVTWLQAVNTAAGALSTGTGLRIMSLSGFAKPVAQVRVGRVTDTQRRRRDKLPELASATAL